MLGVPTKAAPPCPAIPSPLDQLGRRSFSLGQVEAATATQQLAGRNITVKGTISCDGRAPGVIDCTGTSNDRKPIAATLNATTGGANCNGTLVISVGGTPLATIPNAKCS